MDQESVKSLKELLDSVRNIDGFPIGKDEDIIALSDPPFYTACPNPYIKHFIKDYAKPYIPDKDIYQREPFVGDVSEGKNHPIYNAFSYHTKVPHKAIMKYIQHYTDEGDLVFDGFCGTGMTGIAAQILKRNAILSELSPIATFISCNYNKLIDIKRFEKEAKKILEEVKNEYGWLYETNHDEKEYAKKFIDNKGKEKAKINYIVWSGIFICPYCKNEYIFNNVAIDKESGEVKKNYQCPTCNANISARESERAFSTFYDSLIKKNIKQATLIPVLINYSIGGKRYEKIPDKDDMNLLDKIQSMEIPYWFPTDRMPEGDESRRNDRFGITNVHHFYLKRTLWILAAIKDRCKTSETLLWFTSQLINLSKLNRYRPGVSFPYNPLSGTLYIASQVSEANVFIAYENKIKKLVNAFEQVRCHAIIETRSLTKSDLPNNTIDYIFTDPPFGENLMYSELNFLWESWLKVFTNNKKEAIINSSQNKNLEEYKELMTDCFKECYRILKPNRWMTVVFHNSRASVWNAIQESIAKAGFIIGQVSVLDKQLGTFKQITSAGAVKNDLVINAFKPKEEFTQRFLKNAGEGMEVDFIIQQLEHLPVKPNIERTEKMLYSKMLAHYVENGFKIKYDATNFYKLLYDNFTELDGYWFLDKQVKKYNEWKSGLSLDQIKELFEGQQILFVSDEKSALTWLYHFLYKPKTYSEIFTAYSQLATTTDDQIPEIQEILENNFILENGKYRRPLSQKEKEESSKTRERELDRAFNRLFEQAKEQKGKIQNVRREALIHGFTKCYQASRYEDILTIADKLSTSVIESSGDIMDFVDIARIKTTGKKKIDEF
jgi:DNA modification methylase/ssDNA-binding Zn-finger/Zn-ribbon topoisomerase 1